MEVQWRFGDMRDLGTWGTHGGSQMGATGHVPPFPNTQGQVLTQGPGDMGITHGAENWCPGDRWPCSVPCGTTSPGCWRHFIPCTAIALSCLSPCMSPRPRGWYHTHQDMALSLYSPGPGCRGRRMGTGSMGTGWARCGTGTTRRQRGHAGGRAVTAVWGGAVLWA